MKTHQSKIEKLIKQLCPEGVEFKELQEIFDIKNGYTPSKSNPEFWTNGTIPWFRMEDLRKNGRILNDSIQHITPEAVKKGKLFPAGSIIIATTATIGEHALLTVDSLANQQFTFLSKKVNCSVEIDMKFMFYYSYILSAWCKNNTNDSSFPSVRMRGFKKFKIFIPPLLIQKAIVKILDTFTELEAAMQAELEVELKARKKQYEYYLDEMLSFEDHEVERKELGEIVRIRHGKDYKKLKSGNIPVYGSGGVMTYVDKYIYNKPTVLIPRKGTITNLFYIEEQFWNIDTIYYSEIDIAQIIPKFFYYFLKTVDTALLDTGSGRPSLTMQILNKIKIPIPPLSKQKEIVATLDKFDALVNDISIRLSAEIKARRQQYEYYREKLLTFPPLKKQHD